jgi:hypothetical protein
MAEQSSVIILTMTEKEFLMNPEFRELVVASARSVARGSYHGAGWGLDAGLIEFARFVQDAPKVAPVFDLLAGACEAYALEWNFPLTESNDLMTAIKAVGGTVARKIGMPANREWRLMSYRDRNVRHLANYPERPGWRPDSLGLYPEFETRSRP